MDEKKKLKVLDKTETTLEEITESQVKPHISVGVEHPNQTNPIYKKLMSFKNSKIGEKLSVKDLLR